MDEVSVVAIAREWGSGHLEVKFNWKIDLNLFFLTFSFSFLVHPIGYVVTSSNWKRNSLRIALSKMDWKTSGLVGIHPLPFMTTRDQFRYSQPVHLKEKEREKGKIRGKKEIHLVCVCRFTKSKKHTKISSTPWWSSQ